MRVVIGSRKSDLARIQAYTVGETLKKKNPSLEIEYQFRESLGDKNLNDPLWKMPEKGVFTEDFYRGLMSGEYDMVVHSWKDLPTENRNDTCIAATLPREDVRDVLLFKKTSLGKKNLTFFTSSPRRIYNLFHCLSTLLPHNPNVQFSPVRGNVQTRVRKMLAEPVDGLILAKAGLDRLLSAERDEFQETKNFLLESLQNTLWMVLPLSLNPTAAAQGALAIEVRTDRDDLKDLLKSIHCENTFQTVRRERELLKGWGGGCHQKIGVNCLSREYGQITIARGERDNGEIINLMELTTSLPAPKGSFQKNPKQDTWFERKFLPFDDTYKACNAHWVSRANSVPEDVTFSPEQLVWTSGLATWQALAKRGIWVNGSSESLGEQEEMNIAHLVPKNVRWCKWTHSQGEPFILGPTISTYELVLKKEPPLYSEKDEHFYWMSGSSFAQALQNYPWLKSKTHWSGPGHTHKRIASLLKEHQGLGAARIALSLEEWLKLSHS